MGLTLKSRYRSLLPAGGKYTARNTRVIISPRIRCEDSVGALLMHDVYVHGKRKFKRQQKTTTYVTLNMVQAEQISSILLF